jgi:hypothetical protein
MALNLSKITKCKSTIALLEALKADANTEEFSRKVVIDAFLFVNGYRRRLPDDSNELEEATITVRNLIMLRAVKKAKEGAKAVDKEISKYSREIESYTDEFRTLYGIYLNALKAERQKFSM